MFNPKSLKELALLTKIRNMTRKEFEKLKEEEDVILKDILSREIKMYDKYINKLKNRFKILINNNKQCKDIKSREHYTKKQLLKCLSYYIKIYKENINEITNFFSMFGMIPEEDIDHTTDKICKLYSNDEIVNSFKHMMKPDTTEYFYSHLNYGWDTIYSLKSKVKILLETFELKYILKTLLENTKSKYTKYKLIYNFMDKSSMLEYLKYLDNKYYEPSFDDLAFI